jgi:hypothetical protein
LMKTSHILRLLEELAERHAQSLDRYGFRVMSEAIDDKSDISARYLDDLYRNMRKKGQDGKLYARPSGHLLDIIAKHLGFVSFKKFSDFHEKPVSNVLLACTGNWWSYVRSGSTKDILKAPVKIFSDSSRQSMRLELRGSERIFSGKIEERGGCLSGFLESGTNKRIGLVFKLGETLRIELLQGVFCGTSSSGNPIAGKEILVRESRLEYEKMLWSRHAFNDTRIDKNIRDYFSDTRDCISIKEVKGFEVKDLGV